MNYGCLRYVDVPLDRFHVLIGPNASGKSTLMDAIKFVSDVVRDGVEAACERRAANFADLVWGRPQEPEKQRFQIALEFDLPDDVRTLLPSKEATAYIGTKWRWGLIRRTRMQICSTNAATCRSMCRLKPGNFRFSRRPTLLQILLCSVVPLGECRNVFRKSEAGRSRFSDETVKETGSVNWNPGLNLSANRSALSILPDRDDKYPASTQAMVFLRDKIVALALNSERMRQASRPGAGSELRPDGSNIPWVVDALLEQAPAKAKAWISHVRGTLQGFQSLKVIDRPDDRHKYLMLKYSNGLEVPSWKASDGTLRLLALTMLAYMPQSSGLYMIEEPENGIHPGALEAVFNSLSSVYDAQVLLATHSPEFVAVANMKNLLCFGKTRDGVVDIVPGSLHPRLEEWQNEIDLGTFFASGVLA